MPHHSKNRSRHINKASNRKKLRSERTKKLISNRSDHESNAKANIKAEAERCKRFIYNYSEYPLSDMQIIALAKGFKFIPVCKKPSRTHILRDFHQLARKMRMKYIMRNKNKKQALFKLPSKWDPISSENTYLEQYLDETRFQLSKMNTIKPKNNLSKAENIALSELRNNKSIVIKPLDKGKACAVVSRAQYIQEAQRQLSAFQYQKIDHDMTNETARLADEIVEELYSENYICYDTREYLLSDNHDIKVPSFYLLVKAHKPKPENSDFCGRPIISGCCSPVKTLSEYLDYFLLPIVQSQETYLKDSPELIRLLANLKLPHDITLVTADVTSLYTNIPQEECINIVVDRLKKSSIKFPVPRPPSHLVRRILELILKRNCFEFNGEFYKQIVGAAQGNIVSPEVSDLVMYILEKEFILTDPNIVFYRRYRDDLLLMYRGSNVELQDLQTRMNDAHPTLKFTFEISDNLVTYLDLQIYKGENFHESGRLDHRINTKATETHQFLSPTSAHCPSVFSALVLGETIRYCRGHTSETDYNHKVNFFTDKLVDRGYDRSKVNDITSQVIYQDRDQYLSHSRRNVPNVDGQKAIPLVLVTTYTPHTRTHDLKSALLENWHIIEEHHTLHKLFPNPPLLAYKRAKNLSDILVSSKLPRTEKRPDIKGQLCLSSNPRDVRSRHDIKDHKDSSTSTGGTNLRPKELIHLNGHEYEELDQFDIELIQCLNDMANE